MAARRRRRFLHNHSVENGKNFGSERLTGNWEMNRTSQSNEWGILCNRNLTEATERILLASNNILYMVHSSLDNESETLLSVRSIIFYLVELFEGARAMYHNLSLSFLPPSVAWHVPKDGRLNHSNESNSIFTGGGAPCADNGIPPSAPTPSPTSANRTLPFGIFSDVSLVHLGPSKHH